MPRAPSRAALMAPGLLALAALAAACASPFGAPPRESQDLDYSTLPAMHEAADRIVRGRLERAVDHQILDPLTLAEPEYLSYRSFTVLESYKGSAEAGNEIHVAAPVDLRFLDSSGAPKQLEFGAEYVLFLKGRARDSQYPVAFGGTLWTLNGEPALAAVEGDAARFLRRSDRAEFAGGLAEVALQELRAAP